MLQLTSNIFKKNTVNSPSNSISVGTHPSSRLRSIDVMRQRSQNPGVQTSQDDCQCPHARLWGVMQLFARNFPSIQEFGGGGKRSEVFDYLSEYQKSGDSEMRCEGCETCADSD